MKSVLHVAVVLSSLLLVETLVGAQQADVTSLRREIEQLRRDYEERIKSLEDRLRAVESKPDQEPGALTPAATQTNSAPTRSANEVSTAILPTTSPPRLRPSGQGLSGSRTESRQRAIAARQEEALRGRIEQVLEGYLDIGGYLRAGYGANDNGGPQTSFQAPGAFSKYRLGNEAEVYGELSFAKNFYLPNIFALEPDVRPSTAVTGPVARVEVRLSAYNPYEDLLTASGTDFGLPEAWASIANVVPGQPLLNVWAGTRFYRRHDIHISDFHFYNMSGAGGGLQDLELPFGKAAVAWIGSGATSGFSDVPVPDAENEAGFSKDNFDLRLYDVPLPLGKGEFGIVLARSTSGDDSAGHSAPDSEGVSFTALHVHDNFLGPEGFNKLSLQFGTGPAKTFTSGFETFNLADQVFIRPDARNSYRFRATEHFIANIGENFSISPAIVYQFTDRGDLGGIEHWASAGVRPIVHFSRYVSLAFEAGVDWVENVESGVNDYLAKFTVAPQVSLGNQFLSRPVIRLYATHSFWGDEFRGLVGGPDYRDSDSAWVYGLQMEAWW